MMFCPSCGAQMPDNAKFCQKCGSPLSRPAAQGQQNARPQQPNTYTNRPAQGPAPQQMPNAAYTNRPAPGAAPRQTGNAAYRNQPAQPRHVGSAAAKAAATAGKTGMGLGTKILIGAAVAGVAVAAGSGLFDDGGGGEDGGGSYKPPVTQQQDYNGSYTTGGNSTGGYTGGGDVTYNQGQGEYFIWGSATPDSGGVDAVLVHVVSEGNSTVFYYVYDDGEEEEMFTMNGTTSSGNLSVTVTEEDGTGSIDLRRNSDGSFSGRMTTDTDEGYANAFTKLIPVSYAGGDNWVVQTTGETLTYDQIEYDELDGTETGSQFQRESSSAGNTFKEYDDDNSNSNTPTFNPVPATPKPSSGNNAVTIPDDVMQVYVTYEVENIEHEYNGVHVPNHIHMPNETEQKRFESLIAEELYGDRLDFWLANKDKW